jgi:hypothetical protein
VTGNKVVDISYPPGTIVYINTSKYYNERRARLNAFMTFTLLPSSVVAALESLNDALN